MSLVKNLYRNFKNHDITIAILSIRCFQVISPNDGKLDLITKKPSEGSNTLSLRLYAFFSIKK